MSLLFPLVLLLILLLHKIVAVSTLANDCEHAHSDRYILRYLSSRANKAAAAADFLLLLLQTIAAQEIINTGHTQTVYVVPHFL